MTAVLIGAFIGALVGNAIWTFMVKPWLERRIK